MEIEFGTIGNGVLHQLGTLRGMIWVGTLVIGIWCWRRAGSADAILDRLRRLVAGKHEISHREMRTYMTGRKDREYFRYIFRISVQTASQLNRVLAWIKRYDIRDDELVCCRLHVEPKSLEILKPTPLWFSVVLFIILLASMMGTLSGGVFALTPPFIKIVATDDWFVVSENGARAFFTHNKAYLVKGACTSPVSGDANQMDVRDAVPLCDLMTNPANAETLSGFRSEQKWFGVFLFILAGISMLGTKTMLDSARAASRIFKRMQAVDAAKTSAEASAAPSTPLKAHPPVRKRKATPRPKPERKTDE